MRDLIKLFLVFFVGATFATQLPLPAKNQDVVGQIQFAQIQAGDTLSTIARRYDMGFFEVAEANPEVDPAHLVVGDEVIIPSQYILPQGERKGIIINLATMRLFYFPPNVNYFYTYPVGIGKQSWDSPAGQWSIVQKIKDPVWVVPDSIYKFRQQNGDPVPHEMPSGPLNPLGYYAMRLSNPTFLIHGTDDPDSVGRRSSAGCIHLYPEDIEALFNLTALQTSVRIINQPYEIGWNGNDIYIAAHLPLVEQRSTLANYSADSVTLVHSFDVKNKKIDFNQAQEILKEHTGVPTKVSL